MSENVCKDPYDADKPGFVLKPCPFCGASDIEKARRVGFPVETRCRECGAKGPVRLTGREADTDWNEKRCTILPSGNGEEALLKVIYDPADGTVQVTNR